jgi:uncharacterized protein (DUF58 family)
MAGLTPEELREVRRLHVMAGRRVDSVFSGDWKSAFKGRGMEFDEVRPYVPGDDVRHLDWNVTARTAEPFVKVFREERQLTVLLAVDVSGSTLVGSGGRDGRTDRRLQIARVAAGLAYAGIRNRDQVGLVTFSDRVEHYLSPRASRGHVWNVIQHVYEANHLASRPGPAGDHRGTDLDVALRFVAGTQRRRAVVVLVSDFLDGKDWRRGLMTLARRHTVHALLVHDPLDEGLARLGLVDVVDAETGRTRTLDARGARPRRTVEERLREVASTGAHASAISTMEDPFRALHRHFEKVGARR